MVHIRQWASRFILLPLRLFFSRQVGLAELISGLATFGWGWTMVYTDPYPTWRSLDYLLRFWDSDAWGWIDMIFGLGQLFAFGLIDNRWHRPWLRFGAAIVLCVIWGFNTTSMLSPPTPCPPWAWPVAALWFANFYLIIRISFVRCAPAVS